MVHMPSEEASRDATVDVHPYVEKIHQDTSNITQFDGVSKNSGGI